MFAIEQFDIKVRSSMEKDSTRMTVSSSTTVFDIKKILNEEEGIPLEQQNLVAVSTKWFGLLKLYSSPLSDTQTISEVLRVYKNAELVYFLKLR